MNTPAELPRGTPEAYGVSSSALHSFIDSVEHDHRELHSLMLLRRGVVVAEGWWAPYRTEYPHLLNSVSKSFTSTAVGLAVAEGRLSVDDLVVAFFPDALPEVVSDNLAALRVKHLLTMSTGHAEDTVQSLVSGANPDWIRVFLSLPFVHTPGTRFVYNSGATYLLSAILQKLTGMLLLDYLRPRLLEPLGITDATWERSPQGIHMGGWGLSVTTEAIARFGQLYLQQGVWNGQPLIPVAWVAEATAWQVSNAANDMVDWQQGYGYQFWRSRYGAYRGDGAFGQYCIVMPDQEVVLAMTGSVYDMQTVMNLVWEHILPGIHSEPTLPAQPEANAQLVRRLASLYIDPPVGEHTSPLVEMVSGTRYTLETNPLGVESIRFNFSAPRCDVTLSMTAGADREQRFTCGIGAWQHATLPLFSHSPRLVASGVWVAEDTFEMTLRFYETSAIYTLRCHLTPHKLTLAVNVDYVLNAWNYQLTGIASGEY